MGDEATAVADKGWLYHPDYPDHWERCPLYSMAEWVNGLAFRDIHFSPTGRPVIKIAEIKGGISGQTKFTQQTFDESVRVRPGDLLFSWSGQPETSIDAFWWRGPEGWLNQHVFRVIPADGIEPTFFYCLLRYLKPNFVGIARNKQTTGLGHVTKRDLENIEAAYPELPEQRAIAHILGTLDDKIELNRKQNETLEAMARALFKAWFVDFEPVRAKQEGRVGAPFMAPTSPPAQHPGVMNHAPTAWPQHILDLFPDRLVESELGEIPEGWELRPVGNFADLKGGKQLEREQIAAVGEIPVFGGAGVMGYTANHNADGFVIAVGRVGAYCGQFFSHRGKAWINNNASLIHQRNENLGEWLFLSLHHADIDVIKKGAAQPFVSNGDIAKIPLIWPGEQVVRSFSAAAAPLMMAQESKTEESKSLAQLRDTLLPQLISGELRIKDAEAFLKERGL